MSPSNRHPEPIRLLTLSGSLRRGSYNAGLLRAVAEVAPADVEVTPHDYRDVPLFDPDAAPTAAVERLKAAIAAADGVVIATPEYNHSVPGALKNAIDHASRPAWRSVFADKPVAVLSASPGDGGGARAQQALKLILAGMAARVFAAPEFCVGRAKERFDATGQLTDDCTRARLGRLVADFTDELRMLRARHHGPKN